MFALLVLAITPEMLCITTVQCALTCTHGAVLLSRLSACLSHLHAANAIMQVYFRVKHGNMEELARHTRDDLWCDLPGVKAVIDDEDAAP
jgi:hypothetical protein